jgi:DNA-binding Lrp family transcriptional regulator
MPGGTFEEQFQLDEKDYEILRLLQDDAKLTVREVAERIHLSATPTHDRIKRLEKSGVIRKYAALLDNRKLSRPLTVLCQVSLKDHDKKTAMEFVTAVTSLKEVVACYNISGEYDFMLKIVAENMEKYHEFFIRYISGINGIGQTKSAFVMDVIKETHEVI